MRWKLVNEAKSSSTKKLCKRTEAGVLSHQECTQLVDAQPAFSMSYCTCTSLACVFFFLPSLHVRLVFLLHVQNTSRSNDNNSKTRTCAQSCYIASRLSSLLWVFSLTWLDDEFTCSRIRKCLPLMSHFRQRKTLCQFQNIKSKIARDTFKSVTYYEQREEKRSIYPRAQGEPFILQDQRNEKKRFSWMSSPLSKHNLRWGQGSTTRIRRLTWV